MGKRNWEKAPSTRTSSSTITIGEREGVGRVEADRAERTIFLGREQMGRRKQMGNGSKWGQVKY
jgi:hypothetical protein